MLLRKVFTKISILLFVAAQILSCTSTYQPPTERQSIFWPPPPNVAKISYHSSFSTPLELGMERGFFGMLSDLITGRKAQRLVRPMSVVVTDNNQIYVADPGAKGIHRFDKKTGKYELITRDKGTIFPSPVALALGPKNSVYVADSELGKVFIIEPTDTHARVVFPELNFTQPTGLAYSTITKKLYIADTAEHHINIVGEDGIVNKVLGKRGTSQSEFNYPTFLWLDEKDNLYVTDSLNFRVQIFDKDAQFTNMFGKAGDSSGYITRPKGVAVDSSGHIYIVDALFSNIQIFNKQGNLLLYLGTQGNKNGEFWLPTGIFIKNNDVYIADTHNQRVQVLRLMGVNK